MIPLQSGLFPSSTAPRIFLSSYHSRRKKWAARAFCSVSPLARPDGPPPNLFSVDLYHFSYLYFSIYLYLYYVIYTTPSTTTHNESVTPGTIVVKKDARSCQFVMSLQRFPVVWSFLFVFALGHMSVFVNMHLGRRHGSPDSNRIICTFEFVYLSCVF